MTEGEKYWNMLLLLQLSKKGEKVFFFQCYTQISEDREKKKKKTRVIGIRTSLTRQSVREAGLFPHLVLTRVLG